uniref:7TM_GPCR_Srx domain-containing protein n=1 Tax=Haemonchus contortus TaxID=6289 RepID=A0A7I4YK28_HAECO
MVTSGITFIGHMIGNTVIALNRYSALCMMRKYDKIWTRRNVRIIVVLQYFVAFIAVSPLIGAQLLYSTNIDGTYLYAGMDERSDVINKITAIAFCVAYALVSGLTNIKLLVGWHRLSTLSGSSRYSRQEKSLLFYALFVFASSSLMCAQQFTKAYSIYTGNDKLKAWVVMQWFWINDVMISIPPFFMLLLSADLRIDCANFILCRSRQSGNNIVMVATRTHHSALGKDSNSNLDRRSRVSTY